MAENVIQVKFGGETSGLGDAIGRVKQLLAGLFGRLRDIGNIDLGSVRESFALVNDGIKAPLETLAQFKSSLRETAELAGAVFLVDKLREMAEFGEKTLNSAYALGLSVEKFTQFSGAMQLLGGDAETAQRTLERLGQAIQQALENPTSAQAVAFKNLRISIDEVRAKSHDLTAEFELVNRAVADSENKTLALANARVLLGRGIDTLAPALRAGAQGFKDAETGAQAYSDALARNAERMDESASKQHALELAIKTLGINGFGVLAPLIDAVTDSLTAMIREINVGMSLEPDFSPGMAKIVDLREQLAVVNQQIAAAKAQPSAAPRVLSAGMEASMGMPFSGGVPTTSTLTELQSQAAKLKSEIESAERAELDLIHARNAAPRGKPVGSEKAGGSGGSGGSGAGAKGQADELETWREQLQQKLEAEHNFFADSTKEELAYWQQKLALTKNGSKEQAEVESTIYGLQKRLAQEGLRDDEDAESRQESLDRNYLSAFERNMKLMVAEKKITLQQALGFDIQYTAQVEEEEKKRLEALIADDRLSQAEKAQYYDKLLSLENDYSSKIVGYQTDAMNNISSQWKDAIKQIDDQFASLATDVIMRTKSIQAAWDALLTDLVKDTLQSTIKGALGSLLGTGGGAGTGGSGGGGSGGGGLDLSSLLLGSGGLGSLVFGKGGLTGALGLGSGGLLGLLGLGGGAGAGGLLGGLFGGGAGATDAWGGIGAASSGATGGGFLSGIGGLFSGLFGLLGFEHGGIVPSAAGGWQVPSLGPGGMLAQVHSQEMVLPAGISNGLQGMIANGGGGGHTFNIGVNAVDASSVARLFSSNGSAMVQALNNALRHGSSLYQS